MCSWLCARGVAPRPFPLYQPHVATQRWTAPCRSNAILIPPHLIPPHPISSHPIPSHPIPFHPKQLPYNQCLPTPSSIPLLSCIQCHPLNPSHSQPHSSALLRRLSHCASPLSAHPCPPPRPHVAPFLPLPDHRLVNCGRAASPIGIFAECPDVYVEPAADLIVVEAISTAWAVSREG